MSWLELSNLPLLEAIGVLGGSAGISQVQSAISALIATYGGEAWPYQEATGATTAAALISSARDAAIDSMTVEQATGLPLGNAYYDDGSNDNVDHFTASLASLFDGDSGALLMFCQIDTAYWNDSTVRYFGYWTVDANHYIRLMKLANGILRYQMIRNGTVNTVNYDPSAPTNYILFGITWDVTGDTGTIDAVLNGATIDTVSGTVGTWTGALTVANIGSLVGSNGIVGHITWPILLTGKPSDAEMIALYNTGLGT